MPPARSLAACVAARDADRLAGFWAELLHREITRDRFGLLVSGSPAETVLRFVPGDSAKTGPNGLHLHLASESSGHQQVTVERALGLAARPLDVGQSDDDEHVVLADPEGNEFCVIEAGNSFLAGCGFLAEVACDGSRAVGVFWSRVLEWPLVWDQDDETAVQSPAGGTKVAWGGASTRDSGTDRTALELTAAADGASEVERLISLGATHLTTTPEGVRWFADQDGARFRVLVS